MRTSRPDPPCRRRPHSDGRAQLADEAYGWVLQPIDVRVTLAGLDVGDALRDPADRMIVATATALDLPLVTPDGKIRKSGLVDVIW